jgi:putative phosphoserine phosphatase/1-acylglycerol-3-phosphate O-acyltransferase
MIAALFDYDGTLYSGHAWRDLVEHHRSAKCHRLWVAAYFLRNMARLPLYKAGLMSQDRFFLAWAETMAWLVRGWTIEEGRLLFEHLTEERVIPNLRQDVVEHLRQHQKDGHLVALVSGTFAPWLQVVAQKLEIPHAVGTLLQERNGYYTGRALPPVCQGEGKLVRARAYLAERNLQIDWDRSYAYADRIQDLAILDQVGHPVAVYPDEQLLAEAQARDWPVLGAKAS